MKKCILFVFLHTVLQASPETSDAPFLSCMKVLADRFGMSYRFSEGIVYLGDNHEYVGYTIYLSPVVKKLMNYDKDKSAVENVELYLLKK